LAEAQISQKVLEETLAPVKYRIEWEYKPNGQTRLIEGGDVIIIRSVVDFSTTRFRRRKVTRVVVRPGVDRVTAAAILRQQLILRLPRN
jgi:hypothetical protein